MKFDLTLLRDMSGGDEAFLREMLEVFIQQYIQIKQAMQKAISTGHWEELGRQAHKLKASIDSLSIRILMQPVRDIELEAKEGRDVSVLCEQLFSEMELVIAEIKTYMAQ
jgi:HPt (histidine-containing phosphotransfer) domain-containing protein